MSRFRLLQQLHQRAAGTALRAVSVPLSLPEVHSAATRTLARQMIRTMEAEAGVGLAGAQVGRLQRIFVAELDDAYEHDELEESEAHPSRTLVRPITTPKFAARPQPTVVINPRVLRSSSRLLTDVEGCLSLPGLVGHVPRADAIDVSYLDGSSGALVEQTLRGMRARIFLHELDHLNGLLFIDHIQDPAHIWTEETYPHHNM